MGDIEVYMFAVTCKRHVVSFISADPCSKYKVMFMHLGAI